MPLVGIEEPELALHPAAVGHTYCDILWEFDGQSWRAHNPPTAPGKHAGTGKAIEPLAPAANPKAFTDTAKVDKWLRRNCNDVLKRECSAGEKADLLAYLQTLAR